jgi:hypothetical protein
VSSSVKLASTGMVSEHNNDECNVIFPSAPVEQEGEDDLDQAVLEEEEQQDIFDAEHNNDDEEFD